MLHHSHSDLSHSLQTASTDLEPVPTNWTWRLFVLVSSFFYRAMHFSAKRGIAIACRLSVRLSDSLSVCPSVCDVGEL